MPYLFLFGINIHCKTMCIIIKVVFVMLARRLGWPGGQCAGVLWEAEWWSRVAFRSDLLVFYRARKPDRRDEAEKRPSLIGQKIKPRQCKKSATEERVASEACILSIEDGPHPCPINRGGVVGDVRDGEETRRVE